MTSNGADAARILSRLGLPTTTKTVIRRVLQLPLPKDPLIEEIARIVGVSSRSVYRILEHKQFPALERRSRTHSLTDPYLPYLSDRWNETRMDKQDFHGFNATFCFTPQVVWTPLRLD